MDAAITNLSEDKCHSVQDNHVAVSRYGDECHNSQEAVCRPIMNDDTDVVSHNEAICNLLIDSEVNLFNEMWSAKNAKSLIKALQPFHEMPSKDRRRRFAAGQLTKAIVSNQLRNIHCFLLGKIIFMSHLGKNCSSEMKTNPNLSIMFEVYKYYNYTRRYSAKTKRIVKIKSDSKCRQ